MENRFCFLKGLVECDSGRIQDCNNKRTKTCPLEKKKKISKHQESPEKRFCFLKGLVDCNAGTVQDCNIKRVVKCPDGK